MIQLNESTLDEFRQIKLGVFESLKRVLEDYHTMIESGNNSEDDIINFILNNFD